MVMHCVGGLFISFHLVFYLLFFFANAAIMRSILQFTEENPTAATMAATIGATSLHVSLAAGYATWRPYSINMAVDSALRSGSRPQQLFHKFTIQRPELVESIKSLFIVTTEIPSFGVVKLGPTGPWDR